jgi:hypothetical protein
VDNTADAVDRERARIRRQLWVFLILAVLGAYAYFEYPRFVVFTTSSQRKYDVTALRQSKQYEFTPECGIIRWSELYISYYAPVPDTIGIVQEGEDIAEYSDHLPPPITDSLLVVDQVTPIISRWLPVAMHRSIGFKRAAGRWQVTNIDWPQRGKCAGNVRK